MEIKKNQDALRLKQQKELALAQMSGSMVEEQQEEEEENNSPVQVRESQVRVASAEFETPQQNVRVSFMKEDVDRPSHQVNS